MRIPTATYRLQFNPAFGFADAEKILPYLAELGISDLYASPIFAARSGSTHGYDVVDPNQINPELGSSLAFEQLLRTAQQHRLGWLQDIVPNHMAYDSRNAMLMDVLANGPDSEFLEFFDIEWEHPYDDIKGKVLAPMLGDFYGQCLERGEIQLSYDEAGLTVNYYSLRIPLRMESYSSFIKHDLGRLNRALGRQHPDFIKLLGVLYLLRSLATETSGRQHRDQSAFVKGILWELYRDNPEIKAFIDKNIQIFNGEPGKPESFDLLDELLNDQWFRLAFWKVGAEELNYRRFFTVNELISMRVEDRKVFQRTHELITDLVAQGRFTGLRIDHVDGLYDPAQYLQRLREAVGDTYILVEKILETDEALPQDWPIQGTSGYDALIYLNTLFCQPAHQDRFSAIYARFNDFTAPYHQLVIEKKRLIAEKNLAGDVDNLARLLKRIAGRHRSGRDFTLNGLKRAISEVLVLFPIYRTYITEAGVSDRDRAYVQDVMGQARREIPQLVNELNLIERLLLLEYDESLGEDEKKDWLRFALKIQQFSGPLMAKGIEDTFFYVYNRFVSLNEVGGAPDCFGFDLSVFHAFNQQRQETWPHAMTASSTHDTKRSEDVRSRLNVLSEIPDRWEAAVTAWSELNRAHKGYVSGLAAPDDNDEYFLYQTLVGAYPFTEAEYPAFVQRIKDYVIKAVREAKVHTAWLRPDSDYEAGFLQFIDQILDPTPDNAFLQDLREFQQMVSFYGLFNSLSQVLLKAMMPGVPDFYQGTELWDLSLVDPDNRRPVDFEQRLELLRDLKTAVKTDLPGLLETLLAQRWDGRIKLFLVHQVLQARQQWSALFQDGSYVPLAVAGARSPNVVAFGRRLGDQCAIAVVPRFVTELVPPDCDPLAETVWQDTHLVLPEGFPRTWKNALTQEAIAGSGTLAIADALRQFPVALLVGAEA